MTIAFAALESLQRKLSVMLDVAISVNLSTNSIPNIGLPRQPHLEREWELRIKRWRSREEKSNCGADNLLTRFNHGYHGLPQIFV